MPGETGLISFSGKELTAAIYVFPINGSYICIPNWQIGTEIASLKDRFWNRESIRRADDEISDTDIDSVVDSLVAAGEYLADHGYN